MIKQNESVRAVVVEQGATLLDIERGTLFDLNRTGALLWSALPQSSADELTVLLGRHYPDIPTERLAADVISM
jgi:hypothetical protein